VTEREPQDEVGVTGDAPPGLSAEEEARGQVEPPKGPSRWYIVAAAILLVVIVVAVVLLLTNMLSGSNGDVEPTAVTEVEATATSVPTVTPPPTLEPTDTPPPLPTDTPPPFVMTDTYPILFTYESAGARPSTEWTGFFGDVLAADGEPLADVSLVVLHPGGVPVELEGVPTSPLVKTGADGSYEIRLADGPYADTWSLVVVTPDGLPASEFLTFRTDTDTEAGVQQIQVIWQEVP
jgi:hypothetical protein